MAAEALAIERGVATEQIAAAEGLALHAAAFNGMPDPVLHLAARAMGVVTGLAALEPDPRAPGADVLLDAALQAATGLQQLLAFRHDCTTVTTPAGQAAATAGLTSAAAEPALEEQRNGKWRYLEFLQVTSLITAEMFLYRTRWAAYRLSAPRLLT